LNQLGIGTRPNSPDAGRNASVQKQPEASRKANLASNVRLVGLAVMRAAS
jgi:hypothetical protein